MSDILKVAITTMNAVDEIEQNYQIIKSLTLEACQNGAEIIFFPENCLYMRIKEGTEVPFFQEDMPLMSNLKKLALDNNIIIHLGSVPFKVAGEIYNSSLLFDRKGHLKISYSKIHLFDIQLENQEPVRESDIFKAGEQVSVFSYKGWSFGQSICYDIRFSEMYYMYAQYGVDVILVPAAFLKKTGESHWHILNRARAIEGQCYVIASAQGGTHQSVIYQGVSRETFGHSLCVKPWGDVEIDNNTPNSFAIVELKKELISHVRKQIPMREHRLKTIVAPEINHYNCE